MVLLLHLMDQRSETPPTVGRSLLEFAADFTCGATARGSVKLFFL